MHNERVIEVEKDKLIETLKKNLEIHKKKYKEAEEGYFQDLAAAHQKAADIAKLGPDHDQPVPNVHLREPQEHSDDYERIIGMLEMDIQPNVALTASEYDMYIRDQWGWKREFETANVLYSKVR